MRLILVCAAATPELRRGGVPNNESLDKRGIAEATKLAPLLPEAATYWTSPMPCAVQTAKALGWRAKPLEALRECDYGSWAGQRLNEIEKTDLDGLKAWLTDPQAAPHGGESIMTVVQRVNDWLDNCNGKTPIAAVTHSSVISAALVRARRLTIDKYMEIGVAPLSLTELRRDGDRWSVTS